MTNDNPQIPATQSHVHPAAVDYASRNWKCLPLRPRDKVPILPAWQTNASDDEEKLAAWFDGTTSNLGVQLGERSGIIDIEYDTDEGRETAGRLFADMFTPTYSTGGRSVHRIFKWQAGLPDVAVIKNVKGLEIRIGGGGKGAQSVFPPSIHPSGSTYCWLPGLSPDDVDVQPIPESVLAMLVNNPEGETSGESDRGPKLYEKLPCDVTEGERNRYLTSAGGKWVSEGHSGDDLRDLIFGRNAQLPEPLPTTEVEGIYRSTIKWDAGQTQTMVDSSKPFSFSELDLTIVESDPMKYLMTHPHFLSAVELDSLDMTRPSNLRRKVLDVGGVFLPPRFDKMWREKIARRLVQNATRVKAPPAFNKNALIYAYLHDRVESAKANPACAGPIHPAQHHFYIDDQKLYLFDFRWMLAQLAIHHIDVTGREFAAALETVGISNNPTKTRCDDGTYKRFRRVTTDIMAKLAELADC